MIDDRAKFEALTNALEEARNGLLWYQDRYPEAVDGSDDEAMARINAALASAQAASAEPAAWRDHVEQRLLTWRQSFVNKSGDQLALDDFMDKRSLDDLIDFVCDEFTTPASAVAPAAVTDEMQSEFEPDEAGVQALRVAIEGECDGLDITDAQARAVLRYVGATIKCALTKTIRSRTRTPEPQAERHLSKAEQGALRRALMRSAKFVDQEPQPDSRGQAREGWKLAPVEATTLMLEAAMRRCGDIGAGCYGGHKGADWDDFREAWAAMLSASPTPDEQRAQAAQEDVVQRLRNAPNWRRESFGHWKDCTLVYDRAPFDAADEIERLRALISDRNETIELLRRAFCALPRYSFLLDDSGGVRRVPDFSGNWVEFQKAHELFEGEVVDALSAKKVTEDALRTALAGRQQL